MCILPLLFIGSSALCESLLKSSTVLGSPFVSPYSLGSVPPLCLLWCSFRGNWAQGPQSEAHFTDRQGWGGGWRGCWCWGRVLGVEAARRRTLLLTRTWCTRVNVHTCMNTRTHPHTDRQLSTATAHTALKHRASTSSWCINDKMPLW